MNISNKGGNTMHIGILGTEFGRYHGELYKIIEYALKALINNHSIFIETPAVTSLKDGIEIMETAK